MIGVAELTWTSVGSFGQNPGVDVPLQLAVVIHVPVFPVVLTVQEEPPWPVLEEVAVVQHFSRSTNFSAMG